MREINKYALAVSLIVFLFLLANCGGGSGGGNKKQTQLKTCPQVSFSKVAKATKNSDRQWEQLSAKVKLCGRHKDNNLSRASAVFAQNLAQISSEVLVLSLVKSGGFNKIFAVNFNENRCEFVFELKESELTEILTCK